MDITRVAKKYLEPGVGSKHLQNAHPRSCQIIKKKFNLKVIPEVRNEIFEIILRNKFQAWKYFCVREKRLAV